MFMFTRDLGNSFKPWIPSDKLWLIGVLEIDLFGMSGENYLLAGLIYKNDMGFESMGVWETVKTALKCHLSFQNRLDKITAPSYKGFELKKERNLGCFLLRNACAHTRRDIYHELTSHEQSHLSTLLFPPGKVENQRGAGTHVLPTAEP